MAIRAIRIKLQGSFVLIFGSIEVPVVEEYGEPENRMSCGESVVELDGPLRRRFRLREEFGWGQVGGEWKRAICVSESGVGERVRRVNFNRLLEIRNTFLDLRQYQFEKVVTSLEIKLIGLRGRRVVLRQLPLVRA